MCLSLCLRLCLYPRLYGSVRMDAYHYQRVSTVVCDRTGSTINVSLWLCVTAYVSIDARQQQGPQQPRDITITHTMARWRPGTIRRGSMQPLIPYFHQIGDQERHEPTESLIGYAHCTPLRMDTISTRSLPLATAVIPFHKLGETWAD